MIGSAVLSVQQLRKKLTIVVRKKTEGFEMSLERQDKNHT